jgi:hypothetical protein
VRTSATCAPQPSPVHDSQPLLKPFSQQAAVT